MSRVLDLGARAPMQDFMVSVDVPVVVGSPAARDWAVVGKDLDRVIRRRSEKLGGDPYSSRQTARSR